MISKLKAYNQSYLEVWEDNSTVFCFCFGFYILLVFHCSFTCLEVKCFSTPSFFFLINCIHDSTNSCCGILYSWYVVICCKVKSIFAQVWLNFKSYMNCCQNSNHNVNANVNFNQNSGVPAPKNSHNVNNNNSNVIMYVSRLQSHPNES